RRGAVARRRATAVRSRRLARARRERRQGRAGAAREGNGPHRNRDEFAARPGRAHLRKRRWLPDSWCSRPPPRGEHDLGGRPPGRDARRDRRHLLQGGRGDRGRGSRRCKLPRVFRAARGGHTAKIVDIDGAAGAGGRTVARRLAERLGYRYLDTGAMYRALTWLAMTRDIPLGEGAKLGALAEDNP